MKPKVSVVIPFYNAKEYIKSCVDSLLSQTLEETEIIIVDDCSTDGSLEYCRDLFKDNSKVRILTQPQNMGPGEARNTGIREACGDYIAFVDSDDQMRKEGLQKMYEAAVKTGADVVHVAGILIPTADELPDNLSELPSEGITPISFDFHDREDHVVVLQNSLDERFAKWQQHTYHWSVWNKLFRREFLLSNDIFFSELKLAEDMQFCFQCLFLAGTYTVIPGAWYFWRVVTGSTSRTKKLTSLIIKSLTAELKVGVTTRKILGKIPYFASNEDASNIAIFRIMSSLELAFIRPSFNKLGRQAVQSDREIIEFFEREYGDKKDTAFYQFLEMETYATKGVDYGDVFNGKDQWEQFRYEYGWDGVTD